jgi:hypothetical protein
MAALQLVGLRLYCDVLAPFGGLAGCDSARAESASWYASGPNGALTYGPSATDMARDRPALVGRSLFGKIHVVARRLRAEPYEHLTAFAATGGAGETTERMRTDPSE